MGKNISHDSRLSPLNVNDLLGRGSFKPSASENQILLPEDLDLLGVLGLLGVLDLGFFDA